MAQLFRKNSAWGVLAILGLGVLAVGLRATSARAADPENASVAESVSDSASDSAPASSGRSPAGVSTSASSDDEDDYNFSWLDPDKKVYVLQNRKYRKANRFGIFAQGGLNLSNAYRTEYVGQPRAAFWFNEQFGVEAFYSFVTNSDNSNLTALKNVNSNSLPFVRETRSYFGAVATWAPWYAKINMFNKILYFDWYLALGAGQIATAIDLNRIAGGTPNFQTENLFALYYGTGQNFFVNRHFIVRWEVLASAFSATGADNQTKRFRQNYDLSLGVGYLF